MTKQDPILRANEETRQFILAVVLEALELDRQRQDEETRALIASSWYQDEPVEEKP